MKKISVVIPVYNEADKITACLQAIAKLYPAPFEVIVVDNNSSDKTATIASSYPFVKLVFEPKQGVVHARRRGFNEANGDIIGRIDADTVLPGDWIEKVQQIFEEKNISAVSGSADYYDFGLSKVVNQVDASCRIYLSRHLKDNNYLWGANMAIRNSAWQEIQPLLCNNGNIHEDFDLAIHLQSIGHKVIYDPNLSAGVSSRRIDTSLIDYIKYTLRSPQTYAAHNLKSRRYMYPVLFLCWAAYFPCRLIYRGYDPLSNTFSLAQLLLSTNARIDPTSNVI